MSLSHAEAMDIAEDMRNSLKLQNEIGFGDMAIKAPDIDFYPDDVMYFDSAAREIHIGVYGVTDVFHVQDESDFVNALNYVRGHEEQHCRSTASMPYTWGIRRGVETVLEYISSKEETTKRRFRKSEDYEEFANTILPGKGIYISYPMLQNIVGGIANSIEDGRIERIRASRFPGFENLRTVYRGRFWNREDQFRPWENIKDDIPEQLRLIVNQILSLATCQLFQKGFAKVYAGTPIMQCIKGLMPDIAAGVMAGRTRDMAMAVIRISRRLAPYLYATCRMSEKDSHARQALESLLSALIKAAVDAMPDTGLTEKDEDTDDGGANTTFPVSDLVVTLDDETYDKLAAKAKDKNGSSGGIMIRREHPKEEEEKQEEKPQQAGGKEPSGEEKPSDGAQNARQAAGPQKDTGSASGPGAGRKPGKEPDDGGTGASPADGREGKPEKPSQQDVPQTGASQEDTEAEEKGAFSGAKPDTDGQPAGEQAGSHPEGSEGAGTGGRPLGGGAMQAGKNADPDKEEADMQEIEAAMKAAAESSWEAAKAEINTVNTHTAHARSTGKIDVPDTDKPVKPEDVKDICPCFKEVKRAYKLTDHLPVVLAARGRTLLRKNEQYFRSLSTPNISYLDSGSIDPSRIYGLSFGDTDIFRKKGIDRKFDGCVYILIDNSGSMRGAKRQEACKAAAVIEESFRGLIPIKIVAFDYSGTVIHEVIKGWNEQERLNCCWNFCLYGRSGFGNADGYDILIAERELLARPEQKKLLIVLSDGLPAEATPGCTKGAIERARSHGIQVNGIYFEEGSVMQPSRQFLDMYGERDGICCPLSELDTNLQMIMKKFSRS